MAGIERRQALVDRVRSVLLVPLMHADQVVGVVSIGRFDGSIPDQTSQTFASAAADLLAASMARSVEPTRSFEIPVPDSVRLRTKTSERSNLSGILDSAIRVDHGVPISQD
jgi:hypothetical protein